MQGCYLTDKDAGNNLTNSTVTFRVFGAAENTSGPVRFDNITITGNVVPEPSTLVTLLRGIGLLALRRRR